MAELEKECLYHASQVTQHSSANLQVDANFSVFVDMMETDVTMDVCNRCMLAIQKVVNSNVLCAKIIMPIAVI